jgi:hypothetical protein
VGGVCGACLDGSGRHNVESLHVFARLNEDFPRGISRSMTVIKYNMVNNLAWRFPTKSLPSGETHEGPVLHVKCPLLLADFNQNWNVSINFSKPPRHHIALTSSELSSSCYMHTDGRKERQGEANGAFL